MSLLQTIPQIQILKDHLTERGLEKHFRFVGGCVRDYLMGSKIKDYDLASTLLPSENFEIFKDHFRTFDNSNGHGTVTIMIQDIPFETTTCRADKLCDGLLLTINSEYSLSTSCPEALIFFIKGRSCRIGPMILRGPKTPTQVSKCIR